MKYRVWHIDATTQQVVCLTHWLNYRMARKTAGDHRHSTCLVVSSLATDIQVREKYKHKLQ